MALGIFLHGLDTIDDVIAIRTAIIQNHFIANGGMITTSWTSEGTSVSRQFAMTATKLFEECNFFLKTEDPARFGKWITRTRPAYNLYSSTMP